MEPGGAAVPHVADESIAGRRTWLRLHNRNHNPMNPRYQAFSTPRDNMKRDTPVDSAINDDKRGPASAQPPSNKGMRASKWRSKLNRAS